MPPTMKKVGDATPQIARIGVLTADMVVEDNEVLADAVGMSVPVEANKVYDVYVQLILSSSNDGSSKIGFTGPAGATMMWGQAAVFETLDGFAVASLLSLSDTLLPGPVDKTVFSIKGLFQTVGTAGVLQVQHALDFAAGGSINTLHALGAGHVGSSYIQATPIFNVPE